MVVGFRFQREWAVGRGLLLVAAMYVGGVGGGAYLVSSAAGNPRGVLLGYLLLAVGKPILHLAFLGRPARFWRALANPKGSWISRGFWFLGAFIVLGGASLALAGPSAPSGGAAIGDLLRTASYAAALFLMVYDGLLLSSCRGVPFWNNGLMAATIPTTSLLGGTAATILSAHLSGGVELELLRRMELALLALSPLLIAACLLTARSTDVSAAASVKALVRGRLAAPFVAGAVILGIAAPLAASAASLALSASPPLTSLFGLLEVAGDLMLKLSLLRAGIYRVAVYPWSYAAAA